MRDRYGDKITVWSTGTGVVYVEFETTEHYMDMSLDVPMAKKLIKKLEAAIKRAEEG